MPKLAAKLTRPFAEVPFIEGGAATLRNLTGALRLAAAGNTVFLLNAAAR
jgi:hypothetical protein